MQRARSKSIISGCCAAGFYLALVSGTSAAGLGARSVSERSTFIDEATGATVTRLTSSVAKDDKIYQTHPNWVSDGSHLIFQSDRTGRDEVFALEEATGEIVQLTDGDTGAIVVARHENALYVVRKGGVFLVNLGAPARRQQGQGDESGHGLSPENCRPAGRLQPVWNLHGRRERQGAVFRHRQCGKAYSIQKLDLATGEFSTVLDLDFQVGHFQAHPTQTGILSYCQETGGDTPQRMWITNSDGSGNRPFYTETYGEWVTHEVWWTDDRMLFAIWPKDERMKLKPYGIASVSLADFHHHVHDQFPYWHVCGTPDGKYAIGDTFEGELYLVDIGSGKRRLLTQGHRPDGAKSHQHQSLRPNGKQVLFVSSKFGNWDLMTVDIPGGGLESR